MAIMGPSGSGKSTLLNALLGKLPLEKEQGHLFINGEDVTEEGLSCIKDRVGFVPQKDILVDELTVLENIQYFHTLAVDSDLSDTQVKQRAMELLEATGLPPKETADKKPGALSGGQRKRASLVMELINDPQVLIVDEPTSGLSSSDSLEIMSYLKNLARQSNKIVMVIIHQPSSPIFKLFDKLLLLEAIGKDGRGKCVASGTLQEIYSENATRLSLGGIQCKHCNTLFPEYLLDAVNAGIIDGPLKSQIKKTTQQHLTKTPIMRSPKESLKDFWALTTRQFRIKFRDILSLFLTFVAPPILGLLIAIVFKYTPPGQDYRFEDNALYGQFLFLMLICGLFLGLVSSVGEIIRDRDMLYRESLRGLSMTSYYSAKFLVLACFGALQSLLFTLSAFYILEGMDYMLPNMLILFCAILISVAIGLVISIWAKTAISAYNLIPLILIPQIVLGGALLPYSNMGEEIYLWEERGQQMPPLAASMPASWLYEGAMSANYSYMEKNDLKPNIKLSELNLRQPGDFLSLKSDTKLTSTIRDWLSETVDTNATYVRNGLVMLGFLVFFIGLGAIDVRKDYRRSLATRLAAKSTLFLLVFGSGFIVVDRQAVGAKTKESVFIISDTRLSGFEAQSYCRNQNRSLAEAARIAELFN